LIKLNQEDTEKNREEKFLTAKAQKEGGKGVP
jgi:hypothetical protein